jgi:parallel beta-helix repeat protein
MRARALSVVAMLCLMAVASASATAPDSDTVHVAPPTGAREADRASILAALAQVQPGGTIQFAPGTYLVGEIVSVTTPRITLLGHPRGTTLRGCDPVEYEEMEWAASRADADWRVRFPIVRSCGTFELSGGHSTLRGFTFEYTRMGVILGCCHAEREHRPAGGGYLVEGNTVRNSGNGIRPGMLSADPTVIRGNTFINTFHAVSALGGHLHILENDISVPEPHRVPGVGHPSFAIALCGEHNVIEGNHIDGHPDGILLIADPGNACRENVIRDNTIAVRRVPFPARRPYLDLLRITDEADSTIVGVPLLLYAMEGEEGKGIVEANLIEGNRLLGSDGIAVEVVGASRNRFVGNTINGVVVRTTFPGNTLGSNTGWRAANGAGVWLSPGSDENEVVGNVFEDVALDAIVIEGDNNRVETRSASDGVRDLGSGNRVSSNAPAQDLSQPTHESRSIRVDGERLEYLDFGGDGLPVLFTAGSRAADTWADFAPRFADRYRVIAITHRGVPPSEGRETGYVQRTRDILALLDSLGFERAVLIGNSNPAPALIYIAEHHPERVAGFVFLAPASEAGFETVQDPSGAMQMVERAFLSTQGRDPDEAGGLDDGHLYRPRYFESGGPGISIPALTFVNRDGTRGLERVIYPLQVAELVEAGTLQIPDSVARSYFERLAEDADMQREVRAAWNSVVAAPMIANEQAFARAFGENLRIVQLDVPLMDGVPVVTGYEYRDAPDLIEADIGQFLADITDAIVIEGDRNGVETRSGIDYVHDLGRANRVGLAAPPADPAEEVRARTEAFFAGLSDDSPTFVGPLFYAPDAVLVLSEGVVLEGLEAITRDFLRPTVARLRGVRPTSSRLITGGDPVVWTGAFRARFAPAADTVEAQLSNSWVRQPDGRWLITASMLELPTRGDGTGDGPIVSRFFHSEGLRLHALDFGGEGVPIVFMPNRDRTAYTFIEFAPRFTDHARVLAVTSRGSGQSEGEADGAPGIAALGRDVIALLDSLGLERAVFAHAWGEVLVYLAEQHPERVAGLVFLAGAPSPDFARLWDEDTTGALTMVLRLYASRDGADPDDAVRAVRERWYSAEYLRTDSSIGVPALVFVDESGTSTEDEQVAGLLALGRDVGGDPMSVPDPVARDYFVRLSADPVAQDELRALYRDRVGPAFEDADDRFRRAFGEQLRMAPVEGRAIGYGYRFAPDLIEPHIRGFLAEVSALERQRSVHVAPPTGDRETDRASILAALERVRPGGTVQFAPGTYLIGGEIIRITVPRLTLLGHAEGTTLRGCGPEEMGEPGAAVRGEPCHLFELAGARQTVRNLTFEHAFLALHVGCCWEDFPYMERGEGGHLIERSTFRSTSNAVRVHGAWTEPSIIRDNRFRNNWHSVAIYGNTVHLLDNDISALEPEEVPGFEFPWDAVGIGPSMPIKGSAQSAPGSCANNVVARNRIEGNVDGIMIDTGRPGDSCRNNVVRDNTIIVSRVRAPARLAEEWGLSEPTFVGTPIALLNYAEAFRRAGFTWTGSNWNRLAESDGDGEAVEESFLEGNVIEGNRIIGAEGLGMEILYASGNRIANNTFTTISARQPFPGNFFGPRPEMGVSLEWEGANGSGIWVSPGSNGNEIVGNTFEDTAAAAIFLGGDRNRVETRSQADAVRDLGSGNGVRFVPGDDAPPTRRRGEP